MGLRIKELYVLCGAEGIEIPHVRCRQVFNFKCIGVGFPAQ